MKAAVAAGDRPPPPQEPGSGRTLGDYLGALRRRWRVAAIIAAALTGGALAVSLAATDQYDATAKLLIRVEAINRLIDPDAVVQPSDPERALNTNVELITEDTIASRVRERLRLDTPVADLLDQVDTDTQSTSDLVSITARDEDPQRAAVIANAFAQEFAAFRRASARAGIEEAAGLARRQLRGLDATERGSDQGRELAASLRELEIAAALQTGGVEIVRPAAIPDERATPRPVLTGFVAALLGLVLGSAVALALELTDRRIKSEDELEEGFGLPLLAAVPRPRRRRGRLEDLGQKEAYSSLATNLRFFRIGPEVRVLMVTSPAPGEGKTSVAVGLSQALTALGRRVLLVEADLRHPALGGHTDTGGASGVSSVLAGVSTLAEELVEVDIATMQRVTPGSAGAAVLTVVPAGPVPPNPQGLLASAAMQELLREAAERSDVVIVDTPPVGVVNDAIALSDMVDGALLVARIGRTTRDATARAQRLLSQVGIDILGLVATGAEPRGGRYYAEGRYLAMAQMHQNGPESARQRFGRSRRAAR